MFSAAGLGEEEENSKSNSLPKQLPLQQQQQRQLARLPYSAAASLAIYPSILHPRSPFPGTFELPSSLPLSAGTGESRLGLPTRKLMRAKGRKKGGKRDCRRKRAWKTNIPPLNYSNRDKKLSHWSNFHACMLQFFLFRDHCAAALLFLFFILSE